MRSNVGEKSTRMGKLRQREKWACRKCCDGWGDYYSLQKCAALYWADTSWVCAECTPGSPDSLTAATSDTQPPAVPGSGAAGGGGAEHSSSFADTTIVGERPARKDATTSVSGDWLGHSHEHDPKDKHTPKWNWDGWDSNDTSWGSCGWHSHVDNSGDT